MSRGHDVLDEVRRLGGFFAIEIVEDTYGWEPVSALVDGSPALGRQIHTTRRVLAESCRVPLDGIELRVAGSIMQLGMLSRMLSPAMACAVLGGWVPRYRAEAMWWQPDHPSPVPIALTRAEGDTVGTETIADGFVRNVIEPVAVPFMAAVEAEVWLSSQISWGNTASAIAGAAAMLSRLRPDRAADVSAVSDAVLATPHLADAGRYEPSGGFRRNTCCLYYRLPGGGLCGDCVLGQANGAQPKV